MLRIAVCDDDERVLGRTLDLLKHYERVPLQVDGYLSGEALLAAGKVYDILLLDIDMGGGLMGLRRHGESGRWIRKLS